MKFPPPAYAGICLLLFLCAPPPGIILAQEVVPPVARASAGEDPAIIELDIRTSTLLELAEWCRRLGLSDGGTKDDLAVRLRVHYGLPTDTMERPETGRIIVIESARSTDYFTLEAVNEEYVRLQGDVAVSLIENDITHFLKAGELLYNRTRNILSASGGVEYRRSGEGRVETFRGESLVLTMDDWTGVFMGGASERSLEGDATTYRFSGRVISRDGEDVTVMTDAVITNAATPEAYWSINASKLWLLPGSEWAIQNAVLKVGEIPMLFIPFFFLPGDELVFHPVLGYRSREGSFLQTTTYLLGRPRAKTSSESSLVTILGSGEEMERERHGIFLRSTGTRRRQEEEPGLSLLFDVYSNLGAYVGTELSLPASGAFGKTDLSFGLGLTRNVYRITPDYYTPFAQFDGTSDWNRGQLFGQDIPFRYRFKASGSLSTRAINLSWIFPFYSDPFVDEDFMNRAEDMDWFNVITGADIREIDGADRVGVLGSYEWRVSASANPTFPALTPYVTALNISNLSSSLSFRTRTSPHLAGTTSPNRSFFYPDRWTLFSFSGSLVGNAPKRSSVDKIIESPLRDEGRSPWDIPDSNVPPKTADPVRQADPLVPPPLAQRFETAIRENRTTLSLNYRLTPSAASDLQFRSSPTNWTAAEDIAWDEHSSILTTLRNDGTVSSSLVTLGDRLTLSIGLSASMAWQGFTYMNKEAEEFDTQAKRDAAMLRTYRATSFSLFSEFGTLTKPFSGDPVWGESTVHYRLRGLLAKSAFDGSVEDPSWEILYGTWRPEDIDTHSLSLNLVASVRGKDQNLNLSANLPPENSLITGDTAIRIWNTTSTARASVEDPFDSPRYNPITFTNTVDLGSRRNLRQELVWDPEKGELISLVSSLAFGGLTASYTAAYGRDYFLEDNLGWSISPGSERLRPKSLAVSYRSTVAQSNYWRNRISYSVNLDTRLSLDLQRYTYSNFYFRIGTTFKVFEFLDLSIHATSQNSVVFRYFQDLPFWDEPITLPGERNPIKDLIDSFRFDDDERRRDSGFKLKAFELKAIHYMGDWTANLGINLVPYLDRDSTPFRYRFNSRVSFLVRWVPIPELKTEVFRDKDGFFFR